MSSAQPDKDRQGVTKTFPQESDRARDAAAGPTPPPASPAPAGADLVGQRLGSYRVVRPLGRGGMGVVYEAIHEQLGQRAAVKTLKPELSHSPSYVQRFLTEAQAASIAQHPGLVKVFDFGQLDDKTLYLLMEFLEGETLDQRISRRPLDQQTALRLARQIASAVQGAHERGIVHRDLKPSNVYIVKDAEAPAGERVKILDFGLAKIDRGLFTASDGPASTTTGTILGSPLYMSPEQCRGLSLCDGKTDVYALGIMLFEMLAGKPPFLADTAGDLIAMHISGRPPSLRKTAPGVSAEIAALVAKMLAKAPAARPDMAEVIERLKQAAPGIKAPRQSTWTLAAALLLGAAAGLFAVRFARSPGRPSAGATTAVTDLPLTPEAPAPLSIPASSPASSPTASPTLESPPPPLKAPTHAVRSPGRPHDPKHHGPTAADKKAAASPTPGPEAPLPSSAAPVHQEEDVDVPALR